MPHPQTGTKEFRNKKIDKILWLDMEMNSLDPEKGKILEIAAIVTDLEFKEYGKIDLVIYQKGRVLKNMNDWCQETFTKNGLFKKIRKSKITKKLAEERFLKFIDKYFEKDTPIIIAGNSIHQDRKFIFKHLKKIEKRLHYRMLDVTSFGILFKNKYDKSLKRETEATHLAIDDVKESIKELEFYTKYIKKR